MGFRILLLGNVDPGTRGDLEGLDRGTEMLDHENGEDLRQAIHSWRPHLVVLGSDAPAGATACLDRDDRLIPVLAFESCARADLVLPAGKSEERTRTLRSAGRLAALRRAYLRAIETGGDHAENDPVPETFHEHLEREYLRAVRYRHPMSLLTISLDPIAATAADTASVRDQMLATFLEVVRRVVRPMDMLFRSGENEIALLLPETTIQGASIVAERTGAQARRLMVKAAGSALPLKTTASIGVVEAPRAGIETSLEVLDAAREALLQARTSGGNRAAIYENREDR